MAKGIKKSNPPAKKAKGDRQDWKANEQLINKAFADLLMKHQRKPTVAEIARMLGLNRKTVERHFEEMPFEKRFQQWRAGTEAIMNNFFKQCTKTDNPKMLELWFNVIEGKGKKVDITSNGETISTGKAFATLPDGTKLEI